MACCLAGAEPLSEPMLVEYYQSDPWEHISVKSSSNLYIFIQENEFECLENGSHFVSMNKAEATPPPQVHTRHGRFHNVELNTNSNKNMSIFNSLRPSDAYMRQ